MALERRMISGKVSCLMATYGRHGFVQEAMAMFLKQDYEHKELVILNNHPSPMLMNAIRPNIRIVNEPRYPTLGACRNRLLELADGEFMRIWDDDDLYAPWTLSQGI